MRLFYFILLCLILFFSFFGRGLYFDKDFYAVHMIIYVMYLVLLLRLWFRKEESSIIYFSFLFFIPLLYIISIFYAESPLGSIHLSLRWLSYILFFILLFWTTYKNEKIIKWMPLVIQLIGIAISIHMFLNVLGLLESSSAFIFNRFAGVLQYPNTFGMITGVFFLFSLILLTQKRLSLNEIIIYSLPLTIYMYMLVGTLSRGMFVIFPLVFIAALFLRTLPQQFFMITISVIASLFAIVDFLLPMGNVVKTVLLILFSLVTVASVYVVRNLIVKKEFLQRFTNKAFSALLLPLSIIILSVLLILDLLMKGKVYDILPANAQQLISKLSDSSTFRERMLFIQDSFTLSKQSPVFGLGGEGWTATFRTVQQLPYQSKRIHNEWMEILVDVGWIGIVVFGISFVILTYWLIRNWKKGTNLTVHVAVVMSVSLIFLHSLLDFNLKYGVVWFVVFFFFAYSLVNDTVWIPQKEMKLFNKKAGKMIVYSSTAFIIVGIIASFSFNQAEQAYARFKSASSHSNIILLDEVETAVTLNPFHSRYMLDYGKALAKSDHNDPDSLLELAERLAKLEPNNSYVLEMAAHVAHLAGNKDVALNYYYEALAVDQFNTELYEVIFELLLEEPNEKNAEQLLVLFEQFTTSYDKFQQNPISRYHNSREFHLSNKPIVQVATAYYITKNKQALVDLIEENTFDGEVIIRIIVILEHLWKEENDKTVKHLIQTYEIDEKELVKARKQFENTF